MAEHIAIDRVKRFLNELKDLPLESLNGKLQKIEKDVYTLFKELKRLRSLDGAFQKVDLSEDIYGLSRLLERKKVIRTFTLLNRAAGLL